MPGVFLDERKKKEKFSETIAELKSANTPYVDAPKSHHREENPVRTRRGRHSHYPVLANNDQLPCSTPPELRRHDSHPIEEERLPPTDGPPHWPAPMESHNRLVLVRRHLENQGLLATAAELASTAYKTSTNHNYQSSWKYFSMWCTERCLDPLCATDLDVVTYLTFLHHNGKSVKVIESARSTVTSTLTLLSPNRSFHRLYLSQSIVKAMHLRTGPRKKAYTKIWYLATLWNYVASSVLDWNELHAVSHQLAVIIMLSTKCRPSHLANLHHDRCEVRPSHLELRLCRPKEWRYLHPHGEEVFEGHDYRVITIARIPTRNHDIRALYPRMIELQGTRQAGLEAVFINMLKSSPMALNTISKLVATALCDAGFGPKYTPKSISHALTTAQRNGIHRGHLCQTLAPRLHGLQNALHHPQRQQKGAL